MKSTLMAVALVALLGSGVAAQDARPAPWALKFTHGPLESYSLTFKDGSSRTYYYIPFTITNTTAQPASLALHFKAIVGSNKPSRGSTSPSPRPTRRRRSGAWAARPS
jgi:hypothetical protein